MDKGLGQRLFDFAVRIIKYSRKLPRGKEYDIIKNQLIKSSTSEDANYEEAQSSISKPDFFNKINITLKEIREANYWLRILMEITAIDNELKFLINESIELKNILGAINSKNKK
ncbi:four helix bundle protein [Rosettibacter firmus]|uniref:four helix bundle protein n=1 Tax=Rosettibacter firmus TaxID=3111522 RepID=UPI00336BFE8B